MEDRGPQVLRRAHPAVAFLLAVLAPVLLIAPVAALLGLGLGWDLSERLSRGVLYGCLFLACVGVGHSILSLGSIGLSRTNMGRGLLYASMVLLASYVLIFVVQPVQGLAGPNLAILFTVMFHVAVALAEETWFRGLIFRTLQDWKGGAVAVFGSALLFGLSHVPTGGWAGLRFSISMGLPYAVVRLKAGSILGLVIAHWLTNLADSVFRLYPGRFDMITVSLLYTLLFPGVSILILTVDGRLHR